jgi:hypothetical protein
MCEFSIVMNLTLSTAKCFSLTPTSFYQKIIQLQERAFSLHPYFVLHAKISLYFDQIETALKSLFKSFLTGNVTQ